MNPLSWIAGEIGVIGAKVLNLPNHDPMIEGALALKPIDIPELPKLLPVLSLTQERFTVMTELVIDGLEGGYYHPSMKSSFNLRSQKMLGDSGETMFGLDKKHGAALSKYPEWKEFWALVEKGKREQPSAWSYNDKDRGGIYQNELKRLASAIMYKWFNYLAGKYILLSSMDEIANDPRLIIHFSYASWNGEGWFNKFASRLNVAVQNYEGDKEMIWREAIKARTESSNAVIRQQGGNMLALIKKAGY